MNIISLAVDEAWLSLVERCVRDAEVASSNLVASTESKKSRKHAGFLDFSFMTKVYITFGKCVRKGYLCGFFGLVLLFGGSCSTISSRSRAFSPFCSLKCVYKYSLVLREKECSAIWQKLLFEYDLRGKQKNSY